MIAEILCVGTELLLGDIVNTNAQFLAKELAKLGIHLHYQTVVGDNGPRIKDALDIAFQRADLLVITGGLGPTKDDMTKEILAEYFQTPLILDEAALRELTAKLLKYGNKTVSESNRKQAYLPEDAIILYNDRGTAPGCIIESNNKTAILLPGPPGEMEHLFQKAKKLYLIEKCSQTFLSYSIQVEGLGESAVADKISHLLDMPNPTAATYSQKGAVRIRITAAAADDETALTLIAPIAREIGEIFGDLVTKTSHT